MNQEYIYYDIVSTGSLLYPNSKN